MRLCRSRATTAAPAPCKGAVAVEEAREHGRDEFPERLCLAIRIAIGVRISAKRAVQVRRKADRDLDRRSVAKFCKLEQGHHPLHGCRTRSWVTIARTGQPGRTVIVGWTSRVRLAISAPTFAPFP